ncbi:MAG: hypothetical protein DME85_03185 [Verrucomicrobia bacterium]|nr:MAG: hypothetical protein DME85_03185 [Verrucomicrobiota bacterium]
MKLNVSEKIAIGTASYVALILLIAANSSVRAGGPGFGPQNNPGMQGNQFGQAAANGIGTQPTMGGPGFGPGNSPGVEGSAYGRSRPSGASTGRSDSQDVQSGSASEREEVINTETRKGKASTEQARDTPQSNTLGGMRVLNRISSETGVTVNTLKAQKSATGLGYGDLETANLLARASGQSFDSIVAKFKVGEGWGEIAHDMGLNLGKIVSAAHRSTSKNGSKYVGQTKDESNGKPSLIPPPGIRQDSIVFTGVTPIPIASANRGMSPVPSATMPPRQ